MVHQGPLVGAAFFLAHQALPVGYSDLEVFLDLVMEFFQVTATVTVTPMVDVPFEASLLSMMLNWLWTVDGSQTVMKVCLLPVMVVCSLSTAACSPLVEAEEY